MCAYIEGMKNLDSGGSFPSIFLNYIKQEWPTPIQLNIRGVSMLTKEPRKSLKGFLRALQDIHNLSHGRGGQTAKYEAREYLYKNKGSGCMAR